MIRCAAYIRVSTEEQRINGLSLETQKEALREYAEKNNLIIVEYYIDAGLTARKKLSHRKELLRLLDDIKVGGIDLILFTKLDRWFRNIADYYKVQDVLDKCKVNWKTIYEDYDTQTSNGRLHINIMLSIAQDEADRTSERIKVVFENKRARGETPASKAPIGYKIINSKLLIDNDEKQLAIDIFNHYDLHRSIMGCVRLAREKYNKKIYDYTIRRMLENRTYIGEFRGIENFCEALISRDQFFRIQEYTSIREFKNQLTQGRVYLFTSILKCKECGHNMTSTFTIQPQKNGPKEFHYYVCKEARYQKSCNHVKRVNEDHLEEYLVNNMQCQLNRHIINSEKKNKNNVIKVDTAKIRKKLEKLKDLYLDDLIDKDSYKLEYESLNRQLVESNSTKNLSTIENYKKIVNIDFPNMYNNFTREEQKSFWIGIIDYVDVDNNNNYDIFFK